MGTVRDFQELRVYQIAMQEATCIFELTNNFPKAEVYALTDQMHRSSRAVGVLVAEA